MIQAIFFDFNGVIVDDERIQMQVYQALLREHGVDLSEQAYMNCLGMDDKTFVRTNFEQAGKTVTDELMGSILAAKTERYRDLVANELPLCPGAVTFLKACARHYRLGIVSMADTDEIGWVLDRAKLRPLFTVMITPADVTVCKPAPDCYRNALAQLNQKNGRQLSPGNCLVIEDSPQGIQAAKAAGMRTLGVTNTVDEASLRAVNADVVTKSLADWTVDAIRHVFD